MKKLRVLHIVIPVAIALIIAIAYMADFQLGSVSSFGWTTISLICPLGALTAMLAAKIAVPRALIALVGVLILWVIFGRAFCSWICPVPVLQKFNDLVARIFKEGVEAGDSEKKALADAKRAEEEAKAELEAAAPAEKPPLTGCAACAKKRGAAIDSRHIILGGSLLTALVFGFRTSSTPCSIRIIPRSIRSSSDKFSISSSVYCGLKVLTGTLYILLVSSGALDRGASFFESHPDTIERQNVTKSTKDMSSVRLLFLYALFIICSYPSINQIRQKFMFYFCHSKIRQFVAAVLAALKSYHETTKLTPSKYWASTS